jgi:hypothetical protein
MLGAPTAYSAAKVRSAIAADRAARANSPEIPDGCAQQQAQSIGDDPEFRKLLADLVRRASYNISGKASPAALIAYIDGRTAGAVPDGWIDAADSLPEPGERVLVARYAGRIANKEHPGYPGKSWIEVSMIPRKFGSFLCDLSSTGNVTYWKRVAAPSRQQGKEGGK